MDRTERFYRMDLKFEDHAVVSTQTFLDELGVSPVSGESPPPNITEVDGMTMTGPSDSNPPSDHAIISCDIRLKPALKSELIVKVGAEGGSITLYGARTSTGWVFSRDVMDQTPELLDEPWIEHSSPKVATWTAALELLDVYPWHMLRPLTIHEEFRGAVLEAVEERFRADGRADSPKLSRWKDLCKGST